MAVLNTQCPDKMTEKDCPLRKYLNSSESALRVSVNETLLMPKTDNMDELVKTINKMHQICYCCHANNGKQK